MKRIIGTGKMVKAASIRRIPWQGILILALLLLLVPVKPSPAISPVLRVFLGFTIDFEEGRLTGWRQGPGTAFRNQPTLGDNTRYRGRGSANIQGRYWIGTYENYQGRRGQRRGGIQGDRPTGSLTSPLFTIPPAILTFRIGGGRSSRLGVFFYVMEGSGEFPQVLKFRATGRNSERMRTIRWDLRPYAGKKGYITIVDGESGGWGHINVDDFRFNLVMPNVINQPYENAYRVLKKYGLVNIRRSDIVSRLSEGRVARTSPAPGALLTRDALVTVMVSRRRQLHMPDLQGRTLDAAREIIVEARLNLVSTTYRYSTATPGTVIGQTPAPRSVIKPNARVTLVLARKYLIVPNLIGKSPEQAREIIVSSGLASGSVSHIRTTARPGIVVRQNPVAGTRVEARSRVDITISRQRLTRVPSLVGLDIRTAERLLVRAGLRLGSVRRVESRQASGSVTGQSVRAGATVPVRTVIHLDVSITRYVQVPEIVNHTLPDARRILNRSLLKTGRIEYQESDRQSGTVLSQSPRAGKRVPAGSKVTLVIAAEADDLLPLMLLGAGGLLLIIGGYTGYRMIRSRLRPGPAPGNLVIKPVPDMGKQEISDDANGFAGSAIQIQVTKDIGVQEIDTSDGLVADKGEEHD